MNMILFRHIINKLNCNFFINIDKKQIIKKLFGISLINDIVLRIVKKTLRSEECEK